MSAIAVDTETFRFGLGNVTPLIVCTTWAWRDEGGRIRTSIVSDGDGAAMHDRWQEWLEGDDLLVFLSNAYDLSVVCRTFPDLEPLVWAKLERGEVDDVRLREKLLALSTHGNLKSVELPDGSSQQLGFAMQDLVLNYLGEDLSDAKSEDSIRTQYDLYTGVPSAQYPHEAKHYAQRDAYYTLAIYYAQEPRIQSISGRASCATSRFRSAVDFALRQITGNGMRVDRERFGQIKAEMEALLSEDRLEPIIRAGVLRPAKPVQLYVKHVGRALALLEEWGVSLPVSRWAGVVAPTVEGKGEAEWRIVQQQIEPAGALDWSQLEPDLRVSLEDAGIKFKDPEKASVSTKMLGWIVREVSRESGSEIKRTDKGGISCDSEVIGNLEAFSEVIANFQHYQAQQKIVSTELPGMMWDDGGLLSEPVVADRIHFQYDALVSTGRTSSFASKHFPSRNGQQIDPRVRPCYLPEEGMWLLSCDYSSLELCAVAQTTYELFGYSVHRDKINSGTDLHAFLGTGLARRLSCGEFTGDYAAFKALKNSEHDKFFKHWRKFAKPVGLGYPGGLGAKTFIGLAKKAYGVDIITAALGMPDDAFEVNSTILWHAEKVGITEANFRWTPFLKGIALAKMLKDVWLETYPEMVDYFAWIQTQKDPSNEELLCYQTPLGMFRAGCTYTAAANGKAMQSSSAEGFCTAVYQIQRAIRLGTDERLRGCMLHNEVHDEVLLSVPGNQRGAWDAICAVQDIMERAMRAIMPDVRISTEAALMEQWRKEAQPVYDPQSGLLVPWQPDVKYQTVDGILYLPTAA